MYVAAAELEAAQAVLMGARAHSLVPFRFNTYFSSSSFSIAIGIKATNIQTKRTVCGAWNGVESSVINRRNAPNGLDNDIADRLIAFVVLGAKSHSFSLIHKKEMCLHIICSIGGDGFSSSQRQ